jgi:predicted nucleotide-binding protein
VAELEALRNQISKKHGGIGQQQVARLIRQKERETLFPKRLAILAVAWENGIGINAHATPEELGQLRALTQQGAGRTEPPRATPETRIPAGETRRPNRPAVKSRTLRSPRSKPATRIPTRARRVIVVHGRDEAARRDLFSYLRNLDLLPVEWVKAIQATGKGTPLVPEVLDALFEDATAVIVLMTPDDEVRLSARLQKATDKPYEKEIVGQARANVFFEAGLAFAKFGDHVVLVQVSAVKIPSDMDGRHITRLTNSPKSRHELMTKLKNAGCDVDTEGSAWLTEGDFDREETNATTQSE